MPGILLSMKYQKVFGIMFNKPIITYNNGKFYHFGSYYKSDL
jgi:hypothetical protein